MQLYVHLDTGRTMKSQAAATEFSGSPLAFIAWRSMRVIIVMLSIDWSPLYRALK
jgi:hypothetical protein